jgi:hypothetical protein
VPVGDVAAREQVVAALLVAVAAALIAHLIAAARGDRAGMLGGAVAGLWLVASPPGWALAGRLGPEVVALAACSALLVGHDRLARGGGPASAGLIGVAAALAMLADRRCVLLVAVVGGLAVYRGRRGARWVARAPAYGGGAGAGGRRVAHRRSAVAGGGGQGRVRSVAGDDRR